MTSTVLMERRQRRRRRRRLALVVAIPSVVACLEMGPAAEATAVHDPGTRGLPPVNSFFELPAPHPPLGLGVLVGVLAAPVMYVSHRRGHLGGN